MCPNANKIRQYLRYKKKKKHNNIGKDRSIRNCSLYSDELCSFFWGISNSEDHPNINVIRASLWKVKREYI